MDAFEASLKGVNVTASRPRLEHAQLMTEADMKRLGRLGGQLSIHMLVASKKLIGFEVIASVQPTHAYVKAPAELDFLPNTSSHS